MLLKNDYKEKLKLLHLLAIKQRLLMPPKMRVFLEPKRFKFAWGGRWGSKSITFGKILLYYANKRKLQRVGRRYFNLKKNTGGFERKNGTGLSGPKFFSE